MPDQTSRRSLFLGTLRYGLLTRLTGLFGAPAAAVTLPVRVPAETTAAERIRAQVRFFIDFTPCECIEGYFTDVSWLSTA